MSSCCRATRARSATTGHVAAGVLRALVAGLLAGLLLGVLQVPATAESAATGSRTVRISRAVSARTVLSGDRVRVHGRVGRLAVGSLVALQRLSSNRWRTLGWTRTGRAGTYSFTPRVRSTTWFRVYSPRHPRRLATVSATVRVRAAGCPGMRRPAATTAWFVRPDPRHRSPLARHIGRLVCSAAPGATIDIAMYFIRSRNLDTDTILDSLRQVARYRHVRVNVIVEGRLYAGHSTLRTSWHDLAGFAHVHSCDLGCHDQRRRVTGESPSIMHQKLVRISDTVWRSGVDPVVLFSSANWSEAQLRERWQSAVVVYDDLRLSTAVRSQWLMLGACSSRAGCGAWNRNVDPLRPTPGIGPMHEVGGIWFRRMAEFETDAGRGVGLTFTPRVSGDPVATALDDFTCTPQHRLVRVAHMFITSSRARVIRSLARLRNAGCDVRVDMSRPGSRAQRSGIRRMAQIRVPVGCVSAVHDKLILVDGVRRSTGAADQMVLMGSQSLGGTALRRNDETLLRLGTATATGAAQRANHRVFEGYLAHWRALDRHRGSCHIQADTELRRLSNSLTPSRSDTVEPQ